MHGKKVDIKLNIGWEELFPIKITRQIQEVFLILDNIRAVTGEGSRA